MPITSTGAAVASIDFARPAMMFVAWPVVEASEMRFTGPQLRAGVVLGDDHQERRDDEADERAEVEPAPACAVEVASTGISSTIQCMTGMNTSAEMPAVMMTPL